MVAVPSHHNQEEPSLRLRADGVGSASASRQPSSWRGQQRQQVLSASCAHQPTLAPTSPISRQQTTPTSIILCHVICPSSTQKPTVIGTHQLHPWQDFSYPFGFSYGPNGQAFGRTSKREQAFSGGNGAAPGYPSMPSKGLSLLQYRCHSHTLVGSLSSLSIHALVTFLFPLGQHTRGYDDM